MNQILSEDHQILADSIRRSRVLWGMGKREELAKAAGVPVEAIEFVETGRGEAPPADDIRKAADVLKFTGEHKELIDQLITKVGVPRHKLGGLSRSRES